MPIKKIIQRTKRFEKAFAKLNSKIQKLFIRKLDFFIDDEYAPSLKTHRLKGKRQHEHSFWITDDIRAIYIKKILKKEKVFVFTFIDIGGHSRVYNE
ncbi:hypothetical protein HYV57_04320 [Candidatus Peregrinibacteria bacterium]|nr:hypothetical protein [Candidatus Peregrinibacteria bacterium]